jgi:hypothetical protein
MHPGGRFRRRDSPALPRSDVDGCLTNPVVGHLALRCRQFRLWWCLSPRSLPKQGSGGHIEQFFCPQVMTQKSLLIRVKSSWASTAG